MGDLLKVIFPPPKISSQTPLSPTIIKNHFSVSLKSVRCPPCLQDSENKDIALHDVNEPAVSASGMP